MDKINSTTINILINGLCLIWLGFMVGFVLGGMVGIREAEDKFCDRFLNDKEDDK